MHGAGFGRGVCVLGVVEGSDDLAHDVVVVDFPTDETRYWHEEFK